MAIYRFSDLPPSDSTLSTALNAPPTRLLPELASCGRIGAVSPTAGENGSGLGAGDPRGAREPRTNVLLGRDTNKYTQFKNKENIYIYIYRHKKTVTVVVTSPSTFSRVCGSLDSRDSDHFYIESQSAVFWQTVCNWTGQVKIRRQIAKAECPRGLFEKSGFALGDLYFLYE